MAVAEYLPAIEHLDDAIDDAQDEVFDGPTPQTLQKIFRVKRSALRLHRIVDPEREVLNRLARDAYDPIDDEHRVYFRDVYDHLVRIHDITESLRDLISGALDTYLSVVSNRTNDIMKTLTLVTVMFLPMSFLAGFFGMNFFGETLMFTSPAAAQGGAVLAGLHRHDRHARRAWRSWPGDGDGSDGLDWRIEDRSADRPAPAEDGRR